ncbi:MAG: DUF721 domain-containing protein [Gammaproteobacteria bacterium]|nr:DUF721 domain-containing protein [Gammaproteobacteria bacterium]
MSMENIGDHLKKGIFPGLLGHSLYLQQMTQSLRAFLPAPLNQHVRIANFKRGCLLLHVDASVWHSRLRFLVPKIMQSWQERMSAFPPISRIQIRVRPLIIPASSPPPRAVSFSADAAALVRGLAETVAHPPLQAALQRLAANNASGRKDRSQECG